MAFPVLPTPIPGTETFNVDAQLFATGLADFAEEANALGSVIDLSLKSTSTTSLTIGTGSKTLTVQTGLGYVIGHPVRIASIASPSNFMDGIVTAYDTGTGSLTVNVVSVGGSGTLASWNTMVLPGGGNFASLSNNKFTGRQVLADEVTLASASTVDFTAGNSNQFLITGTTTITAVTMAQGAVVKARFSGACQLTNGANLQLQGGANYTTTAGDILTFSSNGTVVRVEISKVNGTAIVTPSVTTATSDPTFADNDESLSTTDWVLGLFNKLTGASFQYVDKTASRAITTQYTNTEAAPRDVYILRNNAGPVGTLFVETNTAGVFVGVSKVDPTSTESGGSTAYAKVPPGKKYYFDAGFSSWIEYTGV